MGATTIHETASGLRNALIQYIEAAYHIADTALLEQRQRLLETAGVIHQAPFLESTPRYPSGVKFEEIAELPAPALTALKLLSTSNADGKYVLHDPPYQHQSDALRAALIAKLNLLIMTGTGSGKTESFLMPIVGKLAVEACESPESFAMPAMRAMVLYPMNALVNDQLARLRAIFGDPRLVELFQGWGTGRPPRFARYTSRTPYAGRRETGKDQRNLRQFREFYVGALERSRDEDPKVRDAASGLIHELKSRGKWPAKPDLAAWFGADNARWQGPNGEFKRAVTLPGDSELVTRHEAQVASPDLMVTNYSMLEYMLMRPIERPIFDQTRQWLAKYPEQRFLIILDEAHLYRGAGGAEVGLLLRRLRDRLQISVDRFQVICATASFDSEAYAPEFASRLTGTPIASFQIIKGEFLRREGERVGTPAEAELFAGLDMPAFYTSEDEQRGRAVEPILAHCGAPALETVEQSLHEALGGFGPLALLVNMTMKQAQPLDTLGSKIFPEVTKDIADRALSNLAALATSARRRPDDPSLLPGRVHTFFRGLRGLWACTDPNCSAVEPAQRGVLGKLYTQPMDRCSCGARVLELFTCRLCGTAYARGYCSQPDNPSMVWSEPGTELRAAGEIAEPLKPIDMLLSEPVVDGLTRTAFYDMLTGEIDPGRPSPRLRTVHLSIQGNTAGAGDDGENPTDGALSDQGAFHVCGGCNKAGGMGGISPVQNHETTGDQPFQVLVNRQLQLQPPSKKESTFAPLRGRKVLVFSDSRQVAARLAPNLQMFSARDALRPLIAYGWQRLATVPGLTLKLSDLYAAVAIAAHQLGVRLRPELAAHEQFEEFEAVGALLRNGGFESDEVVREICEQLRQSDGPPESLLADIITTVRDRSLGLEALALASIVERDDKRKKILDLPDIPGVTESEQDRVQLARAWLRQWQHAGFWLPFMSQQWYRLHPNRKVRVTPLSRSFQRFIGRLPGAAAKKFFKECWLQPLLDTFTKPVERELYRLDGNALSLSFAPGWMRCEACKSVHRPVRLLPVCPDCGRPNPTAMDPDSDASFRKRKGYYRNPVIEVLNGDRSAAMSLVAAEHTAQLNSAQKEEVFSKAEVNELLFQDVELPPDGSSTRRSAIDVLSSTTTMEVGIDIGQLSGVALRNMPPARANYQQRAGRAGRRGSAIASVVAFGGSDTHDEHFFAHPAEMISGAVVDPKLSLDNVEIAQRHLRAFLLQTYIQARIFSPGEGEANLFSVLGTVPAFLSATAPLNRTDFEMWLRESAIDLRARADGWLPHELARADRERLLDGMIDECLTSIDGAIGAMPVANDQSIGNGEADASGPEVQAEVNDVRPPSSPASSNLLDALLYKGILPRYAFPTDVATFHVFNNARSTRFRPIFEYTPSQGAPVALSQYAPGKQVWIAGRCYISGAIYSPMHVDLDRQWDARKLQLECERCGYTLLAQRDVDVALNKRMDCPACNGELTLGPARYWFRPTGFAHPQEQPALLSPEEIPETTYATRAKLIMGSQDAKDWTSLSDRIRFCNAHTHLLVSNNGPGRRGYTYCLKCGRIESTLTSVGSLSVPHSKPYPDPGKQTCRGGATVQGVILGTDFITDVTLFSFKLADDVKLRPADSITRVALRTLCEALSRAATEILQIEAGEVVAEFRPAVTPAGCQGLEAEIFLYDTLPGGAGFARQAAARGLALFEEARRYMLECPEHCDLSCYRCLRSFRNRLDHGALDRHIGVALVDYLLSGSLGDFDAQRIESSTDLLLADLSRQLGAKARLSVLPPTDDAHGCRHPRPILAQVPGGRSFVLSVINPLREPMDNQVVDVNGQSHALIEVNELMVRRNLAEASSAVLAMLT